MSIFDLKYYFATTQSNQVNMNKSHALSVLRSQLKHLKRKPSPSPSDIKAIMRTKALIAYYKGNNTASIASCYDVSERSLKNWIKNFERFGGKSLEDAPREGRPPKLTKEQGEELKRIIVEDSQRVWVARHVFFLLSTVFGVVYSGKYLPEILKKLGLSFHKAVHYLIKRDSEKRREWIKTILPQIYQDKIRNGWRVFYQDEVGFQSEGTLAYTWGIRGKQIDIKNYGRHGRLNLIGAFELGSGMFHSILTSFTVNACRFRRFICSLKRQLRNEKIILICDNAKFHKANWLTDWVKNQSAWLRLEFLPAYSPDFNPIERLWKWIKTEFLHNKCWKTKGIFKKQLIDIQEKMTSNDNGFRTVMKKEIERFEAICDFYRGEPPELFDPLK